MENLPTEEIVRRALKFSASRLKRQHELAVKFGFKALTLPDLAAVLDEACKVTSAGIDSKFAKVLRYLPDENCFLLQEGVGWDRADIGHVRLGADDASPAGFALSSGQPVITNHLGGEHRFRTPDLLRRYHIERAINVQIRGISGCYGVLEADSQNGDEFTESDIVFLELVSNVITMTMERFDAEKQNRRAESFSVGILNASTDCIKVIDTDGSIAFINTAGLRDMEVLRLDDVRGLPWASLWPTPQHDAIGQAVRQAANGETVRLELPRMVDGKPCWWEVSVAPIRDPLGQVEQLMSVARDITEQHEYEIRLENLISAGQNQIDSGELMMKEVHHRVRNSLQLVNTLLFLQGNMADDEVVKNQLKIAANRVLTVASVHERLYQDNGAMATDSALYLKGLIGDLHSSFDDRPVELLASTMVIPAARLAPLGLVTSELITNALKYGRGRITVELAKKGSELILSVSDEGPGLPENFPKPQGTGLGTRLVRTYAGFGPDSIFVDRSKPFSKVCVRFREH